MSSRLPVMETSRLRTMVKVVQIFLALAVIVSIRYFKSTTSIKVICGPEMFTSWNMTVSDRSRNSTMTTLFSGVEELKSSTTTRVKPSSEMDNSTTMRPRFEMDNSTTMRPRFEMDNSTTMRPRSEIDNSTTTRPRFETFLNYTIQFPFKSPRVMEAESCNETSHKIARAVHPSMRLPAMVLVMTATVSGMYCFMYVYAYSGFDSFSRPQIVSEVITGILLTLFWFLSSVSWSSSVAHIKHFGTHFMYYSHLCDDPTAYCAKTVSGSSYCSLYLSLIFCFFNFLTWFTLTCLRIHSSAFLLFPSCFSSTAQAKFSRVKSGDQSFHSLNNSQTLNASPSIATIEDKIEFQRDDFFQSLNQPKRQLFRTAGGSINNPNYEPKRQLSQTAGGSISNPNYDPDDFVNYDGKK